MSESRIVVTIKVTNNFDPNLYEGLLDDDGDVDVEEAAAWEQSQYDAGEFDIIDYLEDQKQVEVTFKGVKGDEG